MFAIQSVTMPNKTSYKVPTVDGIGMQIYMLTEQLKKKNEKNKNGTWNKSYFKLKNRIVALQTARVRAQKKTEYFNWLAR